MLTPTRFAVCTWHSIFKQYPNRASRIISGGLSHRCSSGLPAKEGDDTKRELTLPKERWDPVAQKFLKRLPVEHHGVAPANFDDYTLWYPIFKFHYLKGTHAFIRFKVYLTFLSASACLFKLFDVLVNTGAGLGYVAAVSSLALVGMTVAGNLCRKLIVQVYVTEDMQYVRLTRFTFFGRRQDIVLPKHALISLADTNDTHRKLLLHVRTKTPETVDLTYDNYEFYDSKFTIIALFGDIDDEDKFEVVFGRLLKRIY